MSHVLCFWFGAAVGSLISAAWVIRREMRDEDAAFERGFAMGRESLPTWRQEPKP